MGQVIAIVSQKGGVGKTTTAVNLAAALAAAERRVLLVDMDPQGNATSGLGIRRSGVKRSIYSGLVGDVPCHEIVVHTPLELLQVVPAGADLFRAETELKKKNNKEKCLLNFINPVNEDYDYIIVDSPPSLGILTFNVLSAADFLVIPLQCEYFAFDAVSQMMDVIAIVQRKLNPGLQIEGILLTLFDPREKVCMRIQESAREKFGDLLFKTVIPNRSEFKEAPLKGVPVLLQSLMSPGSVSYFDLAREILKRLSRTPELASRAFD